MLNSPRYGLYLIQFLNKEPATARIGAQKPQDCKPYADHKAVKIGKVQGGFEIRYHEFADAYAPDTFVFSPMATFDSVERVVAAEKSVKAHFKSDRINNSEYISLEYVDVLDIMRYMKSMNA